LSDLGFQLLSLSILLKATVVHPPQKPQSS